MNKPEPRTPWTNREVSLLHKHYPNTNNEDIALIIGRSTHAVSHKASKLGLRKSESFLKSADSGRFRVKISLKQRFLNWLKK